jgi:hypothetical protein
MKINTLGEGMAKGAVLDGPQVLKKTQRVNLNLPMKSYQDLEILADKTGRTMTDILRFGLSMVKLYLEETEQGRKLFIASPNGKAISEIRFPDV